VNQSETDVARNSTSNVGTLSENSTRPWMRAERSTETERLVRRESVKSRTASSEKRKSVLLERQRRRLRVKRRRRPSSLSLRLFVKRRDKKLSLSQSCKLSVQRMPRDVGLKPNLLHVDHLHSWNVKARHLVLSDHLFLSLEPSWAGEKRRCYVRRARKYHQLAQSHQWLVHLLWVVRFRLSASPLTTVLLLPVLPVSPLLVESHPGETVKQLRKAVELLRTTLLHLHHLAFLLPVVPRWLVVGLGVERKAGMGLQHHLQLRLVSH